MKNEEVVTKMISALEQKNWKIVENKLTEDFTFSGGTPQPLGKKEWEKVYRAIQTGIPDLKFNLKQVTMKSDDKVSAKVKLSGTHTADLPTAIPGYKTIPATGKKIAMPEEEIEFTLKGDKISKIFFKPVPHGGLQGMLEELKEAAVGSMKI